MTAAVDTPDALELAPVRYLPIAEWTRRAQDMRARADRSRASRRVLLERACRDAGLEPMTLHNALVGLAQGRPWREVNYSHARRADRIRRDMFAASRIVDRWHARNRPSFEKEGTV